MQIKFWCFAAHICISAWMLGLDFLPCGVHLWHISMSQIFIDYIKFLKNFKGHFWKFLFNYWNFIVFCSQFETCTNYTKNEIYFFSVLKYTLTLYLCTFIFEQTMCASIPWVWPLIGTLWSVVVRIYQVFRVTFRSMIAVYWYLLAY